MLLYLFITCFPFILLLNHKPWKKSSFCSHLLCLLLSNPSPLFIFPKKITQMMMMNFSSFSKVENVEEERDALYQQRQEYQLCFLDLPDLALESILEKLPPSSLCSMAGVCTTLRERCRSDHLWEKHMKSKWGRILGPAAFREWQWFIATSHDASSTIRQNKQRVWLKFMTLFKSFAWSRTKLDLVSSNKRSTLLPLNSVMSWYLALESGRFWFPAQVYNRENGHVGFMLSCYDAELSYDAATDTFQARYPPHGRRVVAIESGVPWERLRAPPIDSSPHDLHISDCLYDLRPGDHIEIQWRRNKEFPYGWWYGMVGHMDSCDGNENFCQCHNSENVVLEFNQYTPGSRWRQTTIDRKDHREEGNEADGFYGGIRKLNTEEEISTWKRLWPVDVLE